VYLTALATKRPLSDAQTQPRMRAHDFFCFHTMVGSLAGTRAMFANNGYGGTESHFGTGGNGELEQWQDLAFTADANYLGNPTVISVENADLGPGFDRWDTNNSAAVPAFTDAQLKTLVALGTAACLPGTNPASMHTDCPHDWTCYREGIPPRLAADTKPGRRGLAYHAMGVPGNGLVPGGVAWSTARGKVCPGARRIRQLKDTVVPLISAVVSGGARIPDVPVKPAAPTKPPAIKAPPFPLPKGHWYGPESNDNRNHSGYDPRDRVGILVWQNRMVQRRWKTIERTGRFKASDAAVARAFQREKGLDDDGLVGAKTWAATWVAPVT